MARRKYSEIGIAPAMGKRSRWSGVGKRTHFLQNFLLGIKLVKQKVQASNFLKIANCMYRRSEPVGKKFRC